MLTDEELLRKNEEVRRENEKYQEARELRRMGYLPGDEELTEEESQKLAAYMEHLRDRRTEKNLFRIRWMTFGFLAGMVVCLGLVLTR